MRAVVTRVSSASVTIDGTVRGAIDQGYLVLLGVGPQDNEAVCDKLAEKICNLRVFEDENGKTNLSLKDVGGALLLVSQFTLYANCRKGNRPSFTEAGNPELAEELYEYIIAQCRKEISEVQTGSFAAHMKVSIVNDGPFNILLVENLFN